MTTNTSVKVSDIVFSDYYDAQDETTKRVIQNIVMAQTGCSIATFYYRKRTNGWSVSDMKVMNQAFKDNNFNFEFDV
ncbi:MAG: hypothetical protein WCJ03_04675 [Bacteroidales bacterium]